MYQIVIETTDNRLFAVRDAGPEMPHLFLGVPVKKVRGAYVPRAGAREQLVRRAGCGVVAAVAA